jgi:peptide/nickel transport system permease protein
MVALDFVATNVAAAPVRRRGLGPVFWIAVAWIAAVTLAGLLAGVLPLQDPNKMHLLARRAAPSLAYLLGTDVFGRDILSRLLHGAGNSLAIGILAPVLGTVVGGTLGMLAGYFGGRLSALIVAATDILLAFPPLVFALAVVAYAGVSLVNLILVLGLLTMPAVARVARAVTLAQRERDFVTAARALGASHTRILLREILPNLILPLSAFFLVLVAVIIVAEGILSFLGLGVPPPAPTWGSMIAEGRDYLDIAPHIAFIPSLAMFLTIFAFNIVGDRLRAVADPRAAA